MIVYYVLLIPALLGLVVLRRRRTPLWVLVAPAVSVTIAAVLGYGFLRLREPAELTLVVAAAVAIDQFLHFRRPSAASGSGAPAGSRPAEA